MVRPRNLVMMMMIATTTLCSACTADQMQAGSTCMSKVLGDAMTGALTAMFNSSGSKNATNATKNATKDDGCKTVEAMFACYTPPSCCTADVTATLDAMNKDNKCP